MPLGLFHYQVLCDVLEKIHYIYDESELANTILSKVSEALDTEAGSVFKILPGGDIEPLASYGASLDSLKKITFKSGKGVVGWVAQYGQPIKVDNPLTDHRFMGTADNTTGFKTRCILAAPIVAKGVPVGVIEFLNKKGGPFGIPDLELISIVGREIGIAFENVKLIQSLATSKAFKEAILSSLSAGLLVLDLKGRVLAINPSGRRILSLKSDHDEENPPLMKDFLSEFPELIRLLESITASSPTPTARKELPLPIKGAPAVLGYSSVPLTTNDGKCIGAALLFQNITSFVKKQ
jgi:PAS domain-containing protein